MFAALTELQSLSAFLNLVGLLDLHPSICIILFPYLWEDQDRRVIVLASGEFYHLKSE